MKTMSAKFTVTELARMMGKPAKEVLFLLQGIGVDVKSAESVLDPGTAQAILTGKTQAPKTLIVRQTPVAPPPSAGATGTPKPKAERAGRGESRVEGGRGPLQCRRGRAGGWRAAHERAGGSRCRVAGGLSGTEAAGRGHRYGQFRRDRFSV